MKINGVLETALYVDDLTTAEQFYNTVLGLETLTRETGRHLFFRCGRGMLLLFNPEATQQKTGDVPTHGAFGPGHMAFAISPAQIVAWRERLLNNGVPIEQEIEWPNGGQSIYFRDPAGNSIELATPSLWGINDGLEMAGS